MDIAEYGLVRVKVHRIKKYLNETCDVYVKSRKGKVYYIGPWMSDECPRIASTGYVSLTPDGKKKPKPTGWIRRETGLRSKRIYRFISNKSAAILKRRLLKMI